jgi:hypothetical protein
MRVAATLLLKKKEGLSVKGVTVMILLRSLGNPGSGFLRLSCQGKEDTKIIVPEEIRFWDVQHFFCQN